MPPKTQPFALPLQKRDSPDKCVEHLDVRSWSQAWEPINWVTVDSKTYEVNVVVVLTGFCLTLMRFVRCWWHHVKVPVSLDTAKYALENPADAKLWVWSILQTFPFPPKPQGEAQKCWNPAVSPKHKVKGVYINKDDKGFFSFNTFSHNPSGTESNKVLLCK